MINLGKNCNLDIQKLIASRMLIAANSGGGKSWTLRRFLEQSNGQVQQIIIDIEGEFTTLREKYDNYMIAGKDWDIKIGIRTAELFATSILESNVSTIIDLSEFKQPERIIFVKRFLESLINAKKSLWHPALIVIDEAHQFCPEKTKAESMGAVIDLMTRGRKRGFCGVLATQRLPKLNKDASAECNNLVIGRASQDIDQKRVADILGITSKEERRQLKNMDAGEVYCEGTAFEHTGVERFMIGGINTTHPDRTRGILAMEPSPVPESIKKIIQDIGDLPKEAEEKLKTTQDMKNKIRELKTKLTILEKSKPKPEVDEKRIKVIIDKTKRETQDLISKEFYKITKNYEQQIKTLQKKILDVGKIVGQEVKPIAMPELEQKRYTKETQQYTEENKEEISIGRRITSYKESEKKLRAGAMKILGWLGGAYPEALTKQRIATLSGFSAKGGTFNTYISELKRNGWIEGTNELSATEEGLKNSEPKEIPSGEELLGLWKGRFRAGAGKILTSLYNSYPEQPTKDEVGDNTGFEPTGGTFNTYISELKRNGLIEVNGNRLKISDEFFE